AFLSYSILKGLDISASLGYNDISTNQLRTTPQTALNPASGSLNNASKIDYSVKNWIVEPQLTYKTQFGKSELNVLLGTTWQANDTKNFRVRGEGFVSDGLLGNIQAATTQNIDADNETQYRYNAAYGRIGYSFDGKYFLNLTGRRDGSSRFGADKQWGNFGAVGGAWIFSRENGIKVSEWLSFGKLRGSYGTTGNDQIGDYGYLSTYSPGSTTYDGLSFLNTTGLANPAYSWEVNKKLEASLDLGLFKDRIQFNTTWYRNRSSSQLVGFNLPAITGFSSVQANLPATVQNTGWEFSLSTTNIQTAHLNWKTSFNLTIPRNKLVSYPGIEESSYANTYVVGEPLNIRKVYQFDGVDPDTGLYQVVDLNNDGSINTEDQQIVIDRSRKFFGGFYNQFSYKGFDLNFLLEFVKQDAAGIMGLFFTQPGGRFQNQLASILDDDRWTQVGDESTLQKFTTGSSTPYSRAGGSDINVTDASFIRLKNIALSYNMPNNILEKLNIKEMQIYLQAQNLYTITNYFGFNPESPFLELPPLRIVGAGVKLNF
ncbi:MAG TPA: SusC/RagA family TonB-linked outer membrane protein, partial [Flavobacteriaceae bacterium]